MKTLSRGLPAGLALAALVGLLAGSGGAGEKKEQAWKRVIPEAAYKKLLASAARTIQDEIDSKKKGALERAQVAAVRAAAYSLSANGDVGNLIAVREDALQVAKMIRDKKDLGEAKRMAKALPQAKAAGVQMVPDFTKYLDDVAELMNTYRPKAKGGDGLAEALQFSRPLKSQNGIEELVRYLAKKKPPAAPLAKGSEELALLAYKLAADGSLTAEFAKTQAKGQAEWRKYSLAQRDAAVRLAEAAAKQDAAAVHTAAVALDAACSQCHTVYRNK